MKKLKKIYVKWRDASSRSGWNDDEEVKNLKDCICESIGYVVVDDKDKLVISQSISHLNANKWGELLNLPKAYILKRSYLK